MKGPRRSAFTGRETTVKANLERIEVDPEDAARFQIGDVILGRSILQIDRERNVIWVQGPSRAHRLERWLKRLWWRLTR
jgi:hypothetical protein